MIWYVRITAISNLQQTEFQKAHGHPLLAKVFCKANTYALKLRGQLCLRNSLKNQSLETRPANMLKLLTRLMENRKNIHHFQAMIAVSQSFFRCYPPPHITHLEVKEQFDRALVEWVQEQRGNISAEYPCTGQNNQMFDKFDWLVLNPQVVAHLLVVWWEKWTCTLCICSALRTALLIMTVTSLQLHGWTNQGLKVMVLLLQHQTNQIFLADFQVAGNKRMQVIETFRKHMPQHVQAHEVI